MKKNFLVGLNNICRIWLFVMKNFFNKLISGGLWDIFALFKVFYVLRTRGGYQTTSVLALTFKWRLELDSTLICDKSVGTENYKNIKIFFSPFTVIKWS